MHRMNGPRTGDRSVTVVLPCLDEVASVGACVREALDAMERAGLTGEVVVVDNGSRDGSAEAAAAAGARVIAEPVPGYGSALRAGFAAARHDVVVMADADLTYPLDKIPALVGPVLADEYDLVLGARLGGATRETMPMLHRFVGTPVLSYLISRSCGRRVVRDSQSGFRAFGRTEMQNLGLRSTGMELASEMLIRAARKGLRVGEIQTGYRERVGSSKLSTFSDGWRHVQLIFMLAPDLVLIRPGATLATIGGAMTLLGLAGSTGLEVGSLLWQPVFFSSIALVLGVQALLAGAVLAHRSSVMIGGSTRYAFVSNPSFPTHCLTAGAASILVGLGLDGALFVSWLRGASSPPAGAAHGIAGLAQSLLITGGTLASFGLTARSFLRQQLSPDGSNGKGNGNGSSRATAPIAPRSPTRWQMWRERWTTRGALPGTP
jgi:hypothetical protein